MIPVVNITLMLVILHIKEKDKCSIQFIREKNFEVAFINMINKLAFSKKVVLQPLLSNLKSINQNDTLFQINKLDMALEENFNKRQKLMELYAKEYLSLQYTPHKTQNFLLRHKN